MREFATVKRCLCRNLLHYRDQNFLSVREYIFIYLELVFVNPFGLVIDLRFAFDFVNNVHFCKAKLKHMAILLLCYKIFESKRKID